MYFGLVNWNCLAGIYTAVFFLCRAVYMLFLIERAKKCLDFSATLYIEHLFICIVYGGWPSSITWWIVNVTGIAVMALLAKYLCIRHELREIPITRYRSSKNFVRLIGHGSFEKLFICDILCGYALFCCTFYFRSLSKSNIMRAFNFTPSCLTHPLISSSFCFVFTWNIYA